MGVLARCFIAERRMSDDTKVCHGVVGMYDDEELNAREQQRIQRTLESKVDQEAVERAAKEKEEQEKLAEAMRKKVEWRQEEASRKTEAERQQKEQQLKEQQDAKSKQRTTAAAEFLSNLIP